MKRHVTTLTLRVDPILCDGYGHCAELAPDLVVLDEWGYPMLDAARFSSDHSSAEHSARLAVRGCPRSALQIVTEQP